MRKIIIILCCVLVFTGCGAAPQQNTVTDTEVPSGTEEILPDLSGIEMPDEIPQELTETDLRRSLWKRGHLRRRRGICSDPDGGTCAGSEYRRDPGDFSG